MSKIINEIELNQKNSPAGRLLEVYFKVFTQILKPLLSLVRIPLRNIDNFRSASMDVFLSYKTYL